MKNLFYLLLLLCANSIYGGACSGAYTFSYGTYRNCDYWFLPSVPGSPTIDHITFTVSSRGTYGTTCDTAYKNMVNDSFGYRFCFSGYHDVTMLIHFSSGQTCTVTTTINVTCTGADVCDPDPGRTDPITNPIVEITYIQPDTCDLNSGSQVSGCINQLNGGTSYWVVCGWRWAIRAPVSALSCHEWTYYVQYEAITSCGNHHCVQTALSDTTFVCIDAYMDQTIYVVATSSSCCLPSGYQRGYYWTPTPSVNYTTICDPNPTVSTLCTAYRNCPNVTYCVTNPITLNQSSGWPGSCFTGGPRIEQRDYVKLGDNLSIEQDVIIYNLEGIEVYKGKWKFGDPSNLYLNWPNSIGSGLYIVNFPNSIGKGVAKFFKFN